MMLTKESWQQQENVCHFTYQSHYIHAQDLLQNVVFLFYNLLMGVVIGIKLHFNI
jgi:hypothetical protein